MNYNAIVLAGGMGTRLRPITDHLPKPLAPVVGQSAYMHILDLLAEHRVIDAAVAVAYKAEMITCLKHDKIMLHYYTENSPLGTAGCVKNAEPALYNTFIVISGDAICDFDLSAAVKYHLEKGAEATILLAKSTIPLEYGGVLSRNGFVDRFIEKPAWRQAITDTVSSGIYILNKTILSKIPIGEPYDFAKDLFSKMLSDGERIAAYECDGYWCDIGDLDAYYRCNFDAAEGKVKLKGKKSTVADDFIYGNSIVEKCIIHERVTVGDNCIIKNSIICEGVKIGSGCVINEGCVVGAYSIIRDNVNLTAGSVIGINKIVKAGNDMFYNGDSRKICEGQLCGSRKVFDCGFCVRLGAAFARAVNGTFGVMCDNNPDSRLLKNSVLNGICENGSGCIDCGNGSYAMSAFAVSELGLDGMIFISSDNDNACVSILDKHALPPSRVLERKITSEFIENKPISDKEIGVVSITDISERYRKQLYKLGGDLSNFKINVNTSSPDFLIQALQECSAVTKLSESDGLKVGSDGTTLEFSDVDYWHIAAVVITDELTNGREKKFALPFVCPRGVVEYISSLGGMVAGYAISPVDNDDREGRQLAGKQLWLRDGSILAMKLCSLVNRSGKQITELVEELPPFFTVESGFEHKPENIAGTMRTLCHETAHPDKEGVRIDFEAGSVLVIPNPTGFRLFAEALNAETASEICAAATEKIKCCNTNLS
ncbi:MAG: hypothetical protein A2Y17_06245 [Clostridiales bacterium GWF2_38_85]|nr:MAG: hypothetical protein A2Y17_06245 [Clostridiales bacterium GWF2_38_85]HBL85492.1 hypothetical protein [Clostridiales bacterium]